MKRYRIIEVEGKFYPQVRHSFFTSLEYSTRWATIQRSPKMDAWPWALRPMYYEWFGRDTPEDAMKAAVDYSEERERIAKGGKRVIDSWNWDY